MSESRSNTLYRPTLAIDITGTPNSGKSLMAASILTLLKKHGFRSVSLRIAEVPLGSADELYQLDEARAAAALESISKKVAVLINDLTPAAVKTGLHLQYDFSSPTATEISASPLPIPVSEPTAEKSTQDLSSVLAFLISQVEQKAITDQEAGMGYSADPFDVLSSRVVQLNTIRQSGKTTAIIDNLRERDLIVVLEPIIRSRMMQRIEEKYGQAFLNTLTFLYPRDILDNSNYSNEQGIMTAWSTCDEKIRSTKRIFIDEFTQSGLNLDSLVLYLRKIDCVIKLLATVG